MAFCPSICYWGLTHVIVSKTPVQSQSILRLQLESNQFGTARLRKKSVWHICSHIETNRGQQLDHFDHLELVPILTSFAFLALHWKWQCPVLGMGNHYAAELLQFGVAIFLLLLDYFSQTMLSLSVLWAWFRCALNILFSECSLSFLWMISERSLHL